MAMGTWPCVVAVCGHSGSGKTTLIEQLVLRLQAHGLRVAAVKACSHAIQADPRGKDSDRLFRAGADVLAHDPQQRLVRLHGGVGSLDDAIAGWARAADLVLAEGHSASPAPKLWLSARGRGQPPDGLVNVLAFLSPGPARLAEAERLVLREVRRAHVAVPTLAGVLVGGESRRMGRPKALLRLGRASVVERVVDAAREVSEAVILLGGGPVPPAAAGLLRLPDPAGVQGPMAGLLSAMRWRPDARWILLSCDLPFISADALRWLRRRARPGVWAVMPHVDADRTPEPVFALYEPPVGEWLEQAARQGGRSIRGVVVGDKVISPRPPVRLRNAWTDVDTPDHWRAAMSDARRAGRSAT
jgi:molybdopterin-guanine dinucleotide biosynthesis protein MobB